MVTAQQIAIEKLSLYFFLSVLDEEKAQDAIHSVLQSLNTKTLNWKRVPKNWERILISHADKIHSQLTSSLSIRRSGVLQSSFENTMEIDWSDWFEFLKLGNAREVAIVLWVKVLGFNEADVASALNITEGTVRYRLNKGLLSLGKILKEATHA